jgi:hypothetical protein
MMVYAPCRTCTVYALADVQVGGGGMVSKGSSEGLLFLRD